MGSVKINEYKVIKEHVINEEKYDFAFGIDNIIDIKYSYYDMHYELEVGIVLSGTVTRYYPNSKMELKRGQIWLSSIWEPHGLEINETPAEIAIFIIKPEAITSNTISNTKIELIAPFFSAPENRPQLYNKKEQEIILSIVERAKETLEKKYWYSDVILKLLSMELLTRIQNNWIKEDEETTAKINDYLQISPALDLVFANKKLIPAKDAAKKCGLSEKNFYRKFKNTMGITFSQYSLGYRVKSSAKELIKSSLPIKEVVYKWGFTDESHYNRLFKKYFNCNPGEYRKFRN